MFNVITKKAAGIAAITLLSSSLLAACGNATQTDKKPSQEAEKPKTTQTVSSLTGAGSTFVYPFFSKAFNTYGGKNNLQVNYQSIGSGGGIQQFTAQTVDFGATDVPMNDTELAAAAKTGGEVVQFPVTLGAEVVAYNVPEVQDKLKLTSDVLANIFLGKIKKWNDSKIKEENPNAKLPDQPITVVHRSDGSGTTYIFTDYLSSVSKEWADQVGKAKDVKWLTGVGAKGNEGVAGQVLKTPYTIGYVELAYAKQTKMTYAQLQNKDGNYVDATLEGATAAAAQLPDVDPKNFSIVNAPGKDSYPIAGYTWALLYKSPKDQAKGKAMVDMFKWVVKDGQQDAKSLDYAPLPKNVQQKAAETLSTIK